MMLAKRGSEARFVAATVSVLLVLLLLPQPAEDIAAAAPQALSGSEAVCGPEDRPETGLQGQAPLNERQHPDGFQGFWCAMRAVGQDTLFDRGSYGSTVIVDHCAYASMRTPSVLDEPTTGTAVLDVSVPSEPVVVDLLRTPAMLRAYSALYIESGVMVGAFQNGTALDVYDVSEDCLTPRFLATIETASGNHDGWLTPDGTTYYGIPFGGQGAHVNPNRIDVHVTDLSEPSAPQHLMNWNRRQLPTGVYERTIPTTNFHDASTNEAGTRLYLALYGSNSCANGLLILDSTDVALRRPDPELRYVGFLSWCDDQSHEYWPGTSASTHTTRYLVHENGKEYIITTDEGPALGGSAQGMCQQRTYSRLIDISDEANPVIVATWHPEVNNTEHCPENVAGNHTGGMPHYQDVDDRYNFRLNFYAASNSGIRVVDFGDPANPKEVGYYRTPNHPSLTATGGTDFTRPDPPYDRANCLMYSGWNQNGLIILEITDPDYNPCMRKDATGQGWLADSAPDQIDFDFTVDRQGGGPEGHLRLTDRAGGVDIQLDQVSFLGSVRDRCGSVPAAANSLQFEGAGTYNGLMASFRVCVQDNGQAGPLAADRLFLVCTEGCDFSVDRVVVDGNIQVQWPEDGYIHRSPSQ